MKVLKQMNPQVKNIPNISANTVKLFLQRKGFDIHVDFRDARLGSYTHGIARICRCDYRVFIACCSDEHNMWTTIINGRIPTETQYILECRPRENKVNLMVT